VERILAESEATVAKHKAFVKRMEEEAREKVLTQPELKRKETRVMGFPPPIVPHRESRVSNQPVPLQQPSQKVGASLPTATQLRQEFEEMLQSWERDSKESKYLQQTRNEQGTSLQQSTRSKPVIKRGIKKVEFAEEVKEGRWPAEDSFA